jgi:hypothetical protein
MLGSGIAVANDPTGVLSGEQSVQAYAIKAAVKDPDAPVFTFRAQKTMYGGKRVRPGDVIFIFASETDGGTGLNFKFYRQATNKVVGLSEEAASYLTRFFTPSRRRASHARSSSR